MLLATTDSQTAWSEPAIRDLVAWAESVEVRSATDEPLRRHTSFGVGGPCPLMLYPSRPEHVIEVVRWCAARGLPLRVLGGGSNLLVADAGTPDLVVNTTRLVEGGSEEPTSVRLPAGTVTAQALHRTVAAGRDGLVWASGLPGTLGGAAAGNAGCWGGEMATSTAGLTAVDATGATHTLAAAKLRWSYRHLALEGVSEPWCIVDVTISTQDGDPVALRARYEELQSRKRERQPVGARNSGCIFRNPDGHAAGAILDAAGCKGLRVGGAVVSERHANFIVNDGTATAADISALIEQLISRARDTAGVDLREEVRRW
jgi:UDP-N-acetylmuramate dehydrogenase